MRVKPKQWIPPLPQTNVLGAGVPAQSNLSTLPYLKALVERLEPFCFLRVNSPLPSSQTNLLVESYSY